MPEADKEGKDYGQDQPAVSEGFFSERVQFTGLGNEKQAVPDF